MKIVIYSTQIIPTTPDLKGYGGHEVVIGNLAKYIDENTEHTIHLFATEESYQPKSGHLFAVGKAGTNPVVAWKAYWNDERSRKALMESDIVVDASWGYYPYAVADKLKHICHIHAGPDPGFRQPPPVKKPNLITVGFQLARRFSEQTGLEWRAVHNGIDISKYPFKREKEDYFLFVGRIYEFKAPHRFIQICDKMKHKGIIIGGSFGDNPEYRKLINDMVEKSKFVEYLGEVPFEKKVELMQNAKAVVVPNVYRLPLKDGKGYAEFPEPFGLVPVEAAAVGSPVVSSPIYGLTETLIHGLNGFHANSIDEFIYYLKRIDEIKPEDCRRVAEHFRYERMGEEYLKLFEEVIEGRGW